MSRRRRIGRGAALATAQLLADDLRLEKLDDLIDFVAFCVGLPRKCVRLKSGRVRPELVITVRVVADALARRKASQSGA